MNMIFLGPPGIGKGTHAEIVARKFGIPRVSTGEIMREEVKKGTDLGDEVKTYMDAGDLVPDEVVIEIIRKRIREGDCVKGFVLDGIPRTVNQAEELEDITDVDIVLDLKAPRNVIIERITGRLTCRKCGAIYHTKNVPPKKPGFCDLCGGELYQREDQSEKAVERRLEMYEKRTKPLIDFYRKKGLLKEVNVEGGKEEVSLRINRAVKDFISERGV